MSTFCRLCAEIKPPDLLLDLAANPSHLEDALARLVTLRVETLVDITLCDGMPKNVCFGCLDMLKQSSEFVKELERAQKFLRDYFLNATVKTERHENEILEDFKGSPTTETIENDEEHRAPDLSQVKTECPLPSKNDEDSSDDSEVIAVKKKKKTLKKKKKKLSQSIPQEVEFDSRATWDNVTVKCRRCNLIFPNMKQLKTHATTDHDACSLFKCIYCDKKRFHGYRSFLKHMRQHETHLKFCCHICCKKFDSTSSLRAHLSKHNLLHVCEYCGESFNDDHTLQEHRNKYIKFKNKIPPSERVKSEDVTCAECGKVFKSKVNLQVHMQLHTERTRNHTCEVCGETFFNKGTLTGHLLRHGDKRPYKCKICSMTFKRTNQLRSHVQTHSGEKPHSCDQCGKRFRLPSQLKSHSIVHTDLMPYACDYCGKSFRFKPLLNRHVRQHTGIKPYSCEQCQRQFTSWGNYNKHMKCRHSLDMSKRKRTPIGVFPVSSLTGDIESLIANAEEWKRKLLEKKSRRKKKNSVAADVKEESDNEALSAVVEMEKE